MIWIVEPTGHKASCVHCRKVLRGKLPKLKVRIYHRCKSFDQSICTKCAIKYHRPEKGLMDRYKKLIESNYFEIAVVEEL